MMFTNYLQHVDCDPRSVDGHSRDFVNSWFNWLTFDNGYHTVHHEQPGRHWSALRALHRARARGIEPHLRQSSPFGYCFAEYALKPLRTADSDDKCARRPG